MVRGGKRDGAGHPSYKPEEIGIRRSIRLTDEDYIKFKALGGAKWLREIIRTENETMILKAKKINETAIDKVNGSFYTVKCECGYSFVTNEVNRAYFCKECNILHRLEA